MMASTATHSRCFCGQFTSGKDSLYCSPDCAHQDALDSLTLGVAHPSSSTFAPLPTLPKGFFSDLPGKHAKPLSAFDDDDALYAVGLASPDIGPFSSSKRPIPHPRTQKAAKSSSGDPARSSPRRQRRSTSYKIKGERHASTNGPPSVPRSITTSVASSTRDDRGSRLEWKSHYQQVQAKRRSKGHATLASDDIPVFLVQLLKDVEEMRVREEAAEKETRKQICDSTNGLVKPPTINYRLGSFGPVPEGSLPSGMLDSCMPTPRAIVEVPTQDSPIEHQYPPGEFTYPAVQRHMDRCNSVSSQTSGSLMTSAAPDSDARSRSSWISRTTGSSQADDSPVKAAYPDHPARTGEVSLRDESSVPAKRCKYGSAFGVHGADAEERVAPTTITVESKQDVPPTAKPADPEPLQNVSIPLQNVAAQQPAPPLSSTPAFKLSSTMEESQIFHRRLESRSKSRLRDDSQPAPEEQTVVEPVSSTNEVEKAQEAPEPPRPSVQEDARPSYLAPPAKRERATSGVQVSAAQSASRQTSSFVTPPRKKSAPASLLRTQWPQFGLSMMPPPRPSMESTSSATSGESLQDVSSSSPADYPTRHLPGTVVRKTTMASKARLPIGGTVATTASRPAVTMLSASNVASLLARPVSPLHNAAPTRPKTPSQKAKLSQGVEKHVDAAAVEEGGSSVAERARGQNITTLLPQAGSLTNGAAPLIRAPVPTRSFGPQNPSVTASAAFSLSLQANAFSSLGSALGSSNTYRPPAYAMSPPKIHQSLRTLHTSASTSSLRSSRAKAPEEMANRHKRVPSSGDETMDEQRSEAGSFKAPEYRKPVVPSADGEVVNVVPSSEPLVASSMEGSERKGVMTVRQSALATSTRTGASSQLHSALKSRTPYMGSGSDVQSSAGSDCLSQADSESVYSESSSRVQGSTRELALSAKTRERLEAARQRVAEIRQARENGTSPSRESALGRRAPSRPSPLNSPLSAKASLPNTPSSSIEPATPRVASPSMSSDRSLSPCTSEAPSTPRDGERMLHITSPSANLVSLVHTMGHVPSILISPSNGDTTDAEKVPLLTRTTRLGSDASNASTTDVSSCGTDHSFTEGHSVMCTAEKVMLSTSTPSTAVRTTFAWDTMPQ